MKRNVEAYFEGACLIKCAFEFENKFCFLPDPKLII
jgi:hypothetical protein